MSRGFHQEELAEILQGFYYNSIITNEKIIDFEFSSKELKPNTLGNCFISISKDRWNKTHGKNLVWQDGNEAIIDSYAHCSLIITESPIPFLKDKVSQLIVKDSMHSLKVIAEHARVKMENSVIAITGSVGKSSTRLIIEHLFKNELSIVATRGNHNTQVAVPLYCAKLNKNPGIGVLELSLNALNNRGNTSLLVKPDICIITSIGEAHLTTMHSTENIAKFKSRIIEGLQQNGLVILNKDISAKDFDILYKTALRKTTRIKTYSLVDKEADIYLESIVSYKYKSNITFVCEKETYSFDMKLPSEGIILNAFAAFLCLIEMGYSLEPFLDKMNGYKSLPKILELKKSITEDGRRIDIIDDSHNAAIPSMINAIKTFKDKKTFYKGRKILVLGQIADLGARSEELHDSLIPYIEDSGFDFIFGHGKYMRKIIKNIETKKVGGWFDNAKDLSKRIPYFCTDDSLVIIKGSVSGSDFRLTSTFLPAQIKRSNKFFLNPSLKNIISEIQPIFGLRVVNKNNKVVILEKGYQSSQSITGLGVLILLVIIFKKGFSPNQSTYLKNWETNDENYIRKGQVFTHKELLDILILNQHPSVVYELAHCYFKTRQQAVQEITQYINEFNLTSSAALNLTGRYRVKEQQAFTLNDLEIIAQDLIDYHNYFPVIFEDDSRTINGIILKSPHLSCIGFYKEVLIIVTGAKSNDDMNQILKNHINKNW